MSIFKAYDIRGKYPSELDAPKAEAIGWAIGKFLSGLTTKTQRTIRIAVGRDVRISSPALAESLIKGLVSSGAEVTDIGVVTTPMSYFAGGFYKFDGSVMVTASHNPAEYNGFKICRENAIALSEDTGLREIERLALGVMRQASGSQLKTQNAERKTLDIKQDYKKFISGFMKVSRPLRAVVDASNGAIGPILEYILGLEEPKKGALCSSCLCGELEVVPLYFEPDGRFPNHEPNPMKDENIVEIKRKVVEAKADFGVAFDGDGDRCVFIDEQGNRAPNDLITALIARQMLSEEKGVGIVYDLRSSWVVKEEIEHYGGQPLRERVGHAFIKSTMRRHNAAFGGELSGHYYFRDNYFADDALLAFCQVLNLVSASNISFSGIVKPLRKYFSSGEINFEVKDKDKKLDEIAQVFKDGRQDTLDGITVEYKDHWFNVRKSNTEPLLRLNIEARTKEKLEEAKKRLAQLITGELNRQKDLCRNNICQKHHPQPDKE